MTEETTTNEGRPELRLVGTTCSLDDETLTDDIISGKIPLFSLEISVSGGVKKVKSVNDYTGPLNVLGGPRPWTISYMQQAGLDEIKGKIAEGQPPQSVTVLHDYQGNVTVRSSHSHK